MDIRQKLVSNSLLLVMPIVIATLVVGVLSGQWLSAIWFVLVAIVSFFLGIGLASQYMFPISGSRSRWDAFGCLVGWCFDQNRSSYFVRDGRSEERIKGSPAAFLPGVILVDSCSAAVLTTGLSATRIVGPGEGFVQGVDLPADDMWSSTYFPVPYENVRGVIDLRRQTRSKAGVPICTRDGIELKVDLSVDFEIQRDPQRDSFDRPYTFSDRGAYLGIYGEGICDNPDEKCDWKEVALTLAEDILRRVFAQYSLDQIFAPIHPNDIYSDIEEQVAGVLNNQLTTYGVHLLLVHLGMIQAPFEVIAQRIENWRVAWDTHKTVVEGQAESEAKRREESARAQAQVEMIQSIIQSLQGLEEEPAHDVITLRLVEALERMSRDPRTRARLSPEVQSAVSTLVLPARNGKGAG